MQRREWLRRVGRATGVAGGGVACGLWLHLLARVDGSPQSPLVAGAMLVLAAGAIVASLAEQVAILIVLGTISFLPIGLYLLMTPSIYAGIGLCDLLIIVAGALIHLGRRRPPGLPAG